MSHQDPIQRRKLYQEVLDRLTARIVAVVLRAVDGRFQTIRVVVNRFASARIQSMNVLTLRRSLVRVGQTNQ